MEKKSKRGRPRKSKAPTGASLREAAAHFGVTRAKLLRWMDDGMPSTLHNERRYIDLRKAQAWRDEQDTDAPTVPAAKRMHPSDVRFRLSIATSRFRKLKMEMDSGQRVTVEAFGKRIGDELTSVNNNLKSLAAMVPDLAMIMPETAEEFLTPLVEHTLEDFRLDSDWPQPMVLFAEEVEEPEADSDDSHIEYLPVLHSGDPRASDISLRADKMELKADTLESTTIATEELKAIAGQIAEGVRFYVREIPGAVAAALNEGDDVNTIRDVIEAKADVARIMIAGPDTVDGVGDALAAVCEVRDFPSVIRLVQDATIAADAPAGAEFDIPDRSEDLKAVTAALASYPDMKRPVSEFG